MKQEKRRFENARTPEEAQKLIDETLSEGSKFIQEVINEALKHGYDSNFTLFTYLLTLVPDDLKDRIKSSSGPTRDLNIEQKMSLREK